MAVTKNKNVTTLKNGISKIAVDFNRSITSSYPQEYDVLDYGADPMGVRDSSASIQAAIDAATIVGVETVRIPVGSYLILTALVPKPGVLVSGAGWRIDNGGNLIEGTILFGNNTGMGFAYNTNELATQPTLPEVYVNAIYGGGIENIGFRNFTIAVSYGAKRNSGAFYAKFSNIYVWNCTVGGLYFENTSLSIFEKLIVGPQTIGCQFAMQFGASTSAYNHGNSSYEWLFAETGLQGCKGMTFFAREGSKINDLTVKHVQTNMQGLLVSQVATMTNGSANITVTDATKFKLDQPMTVSLDVNGFVKHRTYFVISVVGNVIQVSNKMRGTAVLATGAAAINAVTYGFNCIEIVGYGDNATNEIQSSQFIGVDMEGVATNQIFLQQAAVHIDIGTVFSGQGSVCASVLCTRAVTGTWRASAVLNVDIDSAYNAFYCLGASFRTDTDEKPFVQSVPIGIYQDRLTSTHCLNLGGLLNGKTKMISGQNAHDTTMLLPHTVLGQKTNYSSNTALGLWGGVAGAIAFTGSANAVWTLPLLVDLAPEGAGASAGMGFEIANCSTTAAVSLTLNCNTGDTFNRQATLTSYVIATGKSLSIRANFDGAVAFWQITGAYV